MTKTELNDLLDMLPGFKEHLKRNTNSLVAKIFGAFTVETPDVKVHFMLLENVLKMYEFKDQYVRHIFDLKGS